MTAEKIPRFVARIDGETVFLADSPQGGLVNATTLIRTFRRRLRMLRERYYDLNRETYIRHVIYGHIEELEDILRALGEEPS